MLANALVLTMLDCLYYLGCERLGAGSPEEAL